LKLFGLKTCDTCRKAMKSLEAAGRDVEFVDVRQNPISRDRIATLLGRFGDDRLVNRRSTTWRGLGDGERSRPPLDLLTDYPTLMKRPVIEDGDVVTLGWDAGVQAEHLG